jgi:hypothetical protein
MGSLLQKTILAGLAATALTLAVADARIEPRAVEPRRILLLYVGAEDCPPCRTWNSGDGPRFRNSAAFGRVSYREVLSPTLFDVLKDENWPAEVVRYRRNIDRRSGVPLWLIVVDGEVVMQAAGLSQWRETVLPRLTALTR